MIHVVFNETDVEVLKQAIALDETLAGDVLLVRDDYAVGPLNDIHTPEGREARKSWWSEVLAGTDRLASLEEGLVDDEAVVSDILKRMEDDPEETVWVWMAQNKHDVCGYYWLLVGLKELMGRVHVLYLNNLPFINEKGQLFYPQWLSQIRPSEFMKAKRLARPVTMGEFEVDTDEWSKLCAMPDGVRLLEGGKKLVTKGLDFYDEELSRHVTPDWQKANKVINHFLNKSKETTGDAYLLWRLKTLVSSGGVDVQGELRGIRDFEVKKSPAAQTVTANGA
jgi:hypothetical protein